MTRQLPASVQAVMGGESIPEGRLLRRLARAGLPTPKTQQMLIPGRKYRFDLSWEVYMVAVEVQGGVWNQGRHTRGEGYADDCVKSALAQIRGWLVIAITPSMISAGLAVDLIRHALLARGLGE